MRSISMWSALALSSLLSTGLIGGCSKTELCTAEFPCNNDNPDNNPARPDARRPDAPLFDASIVTATITGHVCLISNFTDPFTCATTGADGIVVKLGDREAFTSADGTFVIEAPVGAPPSFELNRVDLTRCLTPFLGGNPTEMTVVKTQYYRQFLSDNGMVVNGTGTLLVQMRNGAGLAAGEALVVDPVEDQPYATRYDAGASAVWGRAGSGPKGMAVLAGLKAGQTKIVRVGPNPRVLTQIPIEESAITIVGFQLQ
jgi:hypothetical protein